MRLSFFPPILPGELLYSALARFGACRGLSSPKAVTGELFGRSSTIATMDLPNNLGALFQRLPSIDPSSRSGFIGRHTLFRYYTAFQPAERRMAAQEAMMGLSGSLHLILGLAAFRTGRPTHLQFCPACAIQAEETQGFLHWRVDHQLPGVLVCATHGIRLRRSTIRIASVNRHAYVPASRENCRADCEYVTPVLRGRTLDLAMQVSRASSALIDEVSPALSMEQRRDEYRSRLLSLGLVRGRHKVDQARLQSSFRDQFGDLLDRLAGVEFGSGSETWLNSIVRSSSGAHPPLQHILFNLFLEAGAERPSSEETEASSRLASTPPSSPAAVPRSHDWRQLDRDYAAAIRRSAQELRQVTPPERVTAAAIERRLKRRDWLAKRRAKLPMSTAAMLAVTEGTEAFRLRRLRWHARRCLAEGIVDPWIVLRRAGLPHDYIELVRAELASITRTAGNACIAA